MMVLPSLSMLAMRRSSALRALSPLDLFMAFDSILRRTDMGVDKMKESGRLQRLGNWSLRAARKA